jgi:hypothetical protein
MESPLTTYKRGIKTRTEAIYHVQFELDQLAIQRQLDGFEHYSEIHLQGPILRLFRGDWNTQIGDQVFARLKVLSDELLMIPGGWAGISPDKLTTANYIEAYIDDQPPWQPLGQYDFTFLEDGPTDTPVMCIDQLERALVSWERVFEDKRLPRQAEGAGPLADAFDYLLRQQIRMKF